MEILSQFISDLKALETNIYLTNVNLDALVNNNTISEELTNLMSIPEVKDLVTLLTSKISELNSYLEPIAKQVHKETAKKQHYKSMEQYAKFIIDPVKQIIEDNSNKPVQLSFDELIKQNPIKPIKHRTKLEYTGTCLYCGATNEYIYDNIHKGQFMCKACEGEHLKVNKSNYKLRYTYRAFNFTLEDINKNLPYNIDSKIDLNSIRHSKKKYTELACHIKQL